MAVVESAMAQFLRNQQPRAKTGRFLMPRTRRWFALGFLLATPVLLAQTSAPAPPAAPTPAATSKPAPAAAPTLRDEGPLGGREAARRGARAEDGDSGGERVLRSVRGS